ncbi:MAG: hypothetical protein II982_00500 [Clostridia bacterium]|nr:hypothetical protein [Clostridia bacterium]
MDLKVDLHIVHENVKFEVKQCINLNSARTHTFMWEGRYYNVFFEINKEEDLTWSDVTQRQYGKKELRFTSKSNGSSGIILIARVPISKVKLKTINEESIEKEYSYGSVSYKYRITLNKDILKVIESREAEREQQIKGRKSKKDNTKIQYICHNPKPYQGGSMSGK